MDRKTVLLVLLNIVLACAWVAKPQKGKTETVEVERRDTVVMREFRTDTVWMEKRKTVEKVVTKTDTVWRDSTKNYKIEIGSPKVDWYKIDFAMKDTVTVYDTKTVTRKPRRWNYGLSAGFGYGLASRKPDLFVGVSVTYSFN